MHGEGMRSAIANMLKVGVDEYAALEMLLLGPVPESSLMLATVWTVRILRLYSLSKAYEGTETDKQNFIRNVSEGLLLVSLEGIDTISKSVTHTTLVDANRG